MFHAECHGKDGRSDDFLLLGAPLLGKPQRFLQCLLGPVVVHIPSVLRGGAIFCCLGHSWYTEVTLWYILDPSVLVKDHLV